MREPVLCYCERPWAYFTTKPLEEQSGDGWGSVPYELNADPPYRPCWHNTPDGLQSTHRGGIQPGEICRCRDCIKDWTDQGKPTYQIIKVAWDEIELWTPDEGYSEDSPYSVNDINAGKIPWLRSPDYSPYCVKFFGGTPLLDFRRVIQEEGGSVYET